MKTLCVLLIAFFCAANAMYSYTPEWQQCRINGFKLTDVTLDQPPVAGEDSTFHFCGYGSDFLHIDFQFVHATSGTFIDETLETSGCAEYMQSACLKVSLRIPEGVPQTLEVQFDIKDNYYGVLASVNVALTF